ncbi:inositol monophosphatase family protein [Lolliginicoccus suaedae]|uniref:inositol monophosphatase family protein n=1 Tax=Lolliginicoccus suaedae TaxID=2605429 RepID=UPI0011EFDFCD|nr:inositol monophosphatase [Lolliginicoccus suaedae]
MASLDTTTLDRLAVEACQVLDEAWPRFLAGHGAPSAVAKGDRDFATEIDLDLERFVAAELDRRTGIGTHGEEFGGDSLSAGPVWVLDPIDGTMNYSLGLPYAGMLLALLDEGQPVIGLTWLPHLGERIWAVVGGALMRNGEPQPRLEPRSLHHSMVAVGSFNLDSTQGLSGRYRLDLIGEISRRSSRVRMLGATGVDLAYTAAGTLGATISFGHHVWDHAAGVALVRAAGGIVTDLAGKPWTVLSRSVLAAAPGAHEELVRLAAAVPRQ